MNIDEIIRCVREMKSATVSLQYAAPEIRHVHRERIDSAVTQAIAALDEQADAGAAVGYDYEREDIVVEMANGSSIRFSGNADGETYVGFPHTVGALEALQFTENIPVEWDEFMSHLRRTERGGVIPARRQCQCIISQDTIQATVVSLRAAERTRRVSLVQ